MNTIPLSLYIHIPWCIKKCPYCDFNSHAVKDSILEEHYVKKLMADLKADLPYVQNRKLHSIFIGGGTPSLFSAKAYETLFDTIFKWITPKENIEITLEANPGTVEQQRFKDYHAVGINRLSIGCQSFNPEHLKILGRIHDKNQALRAADAACKAGFTNFNLDLMFALPSQTIAEALEDLTTAISLNPTHLSWYQLTLEPNTLFHKFPPALPDDELMADMFAAGQALLADHHFLQYEVSAYAQKNQQCQHNLNYWQFGDYLGIGAGAHSKLTNFSTFSTGKIHRLLKHKHPKTYIEADNFISEAIEIAESALPFEFMLNALRLNQPISSHLFETRTGLSFAVIKPNIEKAINKGLLIFDGVVFYPTKLGQRFLNDLVEMFL